jgi:hypothetical protein
MRSSAYDMRLKMGACVRLNLATHSVYISSPTRNRMQSPTWRAAANNCVARTTTHLHYIA